MPRSRRSVTILSLAVVAAASPAAKAQTAPSAAALVAALGEGQSDVQTEAALAALAAAPSPASQPTLLRYARHRRAAVRKLAYEALSRLAAADAAALVAAGLRDAEPEVRAQVALALVRIGTAKELPSLFLALDKGVGEAAAAIGAIGDGSALSRFHDSLGKQPLRVMFLGYERFLLRRDLPRADKLQILAKLEETAGAEVHAFLQQLLARGSFADASQLQQAARASAARTRPAAKAARP